jgi:hypothetical protein
MCLSLWLKSKEGKNCKTVVENINTMGEQMFMMKNDVVGWPAAVSDDLVQGVYKEMCER